MRRQSTAIWLMIVAACASPAWAAVLQVGPDKPYKTVQAAVDAAADGDIIEIDSGTYVGSEGNALITKNNLTLRGVGPTRPIMDAGGTSIQGKAIWVIQGSNPTVEWIEFRNCSVPDRNGAGIRQEGPNLTVRYCYFHDNEDGILTGADTSSEILIEYSEFSNNGYGDGYTHNIYIGNVGTFTLRYCWVHNAYKGQEVKSRAQVNYILYNRIMNQDGPGNYEIDIPNGGTTYIIGNIIQQSPDGTNSGIITYAVEGATNPDQHLYVVNNTIVNERSAGTFVRNASTTECLVRNNIFQGPGTVLDGPGVLIDNWITDNAYLRDPGNYDYHLTADSIGAIDAGSDPGYGLGYPLTPIYQYLHPCNYEDRPSDGILDIGAYEYVDTSGNQAPQVDAGADQTITWPNDTVNLDGTVTDDGLPNPPGTVTTLWTKVSGPGTVTFGDATAVDTTATFSEAGVYVLQLAADDGELRSSDTVTITVNPEPGTGPQTLFFDDFESGDFAAGGWTVGSRDASVSSEGAYNGVFGAELDKATWISKALSTVGYTNIHVRFWCRTDRLDAGEYLYCEWSDDGGQTWYVLGSIQSTSWVQQDFTCPVGAENNANFQIRFRTNANAKTEKGLVDDVEIVGTPQ